MWQAELPSNFILRRSPFPDIVNWLFPRRTCEIHPMNVGNIPSGTCAVVRCYFYWFCFISVLHSACAGFCSCVSVCTSTAALSESTLCFHNYPRCCAACFLVFLFWTIYFTDILFPSVPSCPVRFPVLFISYLLHPPLFTDRSPCLSSLIASSFRLWQWPWWNWQQTLFFPLVHPRISISPYLSCLVYPIFGVLLACLLWLIPSFYPLLAHHNDWNSENRAFLCQAIFKNIYYKHG